MLNPSIFSINILPKKSVFLKKPDVTPLWFRAIIGSHFLWDDFPLSQSTTVVFGYIFLVQEVLPAVVVRVWSRYLRILKEPQSSVFISPAQRKV